MIRFVSQLPKGLRKSLALKMNYRMSFLYGNYITLRNLSARRTKKDCAAVNAVMPCIVHSKNKCQLHYWKPQSSSCSERTQFLRKIRIRMHAQVVVPGYNDGQELQRRP